MKRRLLARLRSRAGESIGEVLIALLISSLAIMMLAGMIAASANMVEKSRKAFDTYYDANNELTAHGGGDDVGAAVVTVDGPGGATYTTAITYHVNDNAPARADKPIISYEVK